MKLKHGAQTKVDTIRIILRLYCALVNICVCESDNRKLDAVLFKCLRGLLKVKWQNVYCAHEYILIKTDVMKVKT